MSKTHRESVVKSLRLVALAMTKAANEIEAGQAYHAKSKIAERLDRVIERVGKLCPDPFPELTGQLMEADHSQ